MASTKGRKVFDSPPVVIGHRGHGEGVAGGPRENTPEAMASAISVGLTWVEIDVRRTADDRLVVLHHPTGEGGDWITEMTGAEAVRRGLFPLDELIEGLPPQVGVDLDLKSSLEDATCDRDRTTAALLGRFLPAIAPRPVLVTSFDAAALLIVREHAPEVPLGLLTWYGFPARKAIPMAAHLGFAVVAAESSSFTANQLDPVPHRRAAAQIVRTAHDAGLEVVVWCPGAASSVELAKAGVDALIVDDLTGVLEALRGARLLPEVLQER